MWDTQPEDTVIGGHCRSRAYRQACRCPLHSPGHGPDAGSSHPTDTLCRAHSA